MRNTTHALLALATLVSITLGALSVCLFNVAEAQARALHAERVALMCFDKSGEPTPFQFEQGTDCRAVRYRPAD